jgi:hypothetical protein
LRHQVFSKPGYRDQFKTLAYNAEQYHCRCGALCWRGGIGRCQQLPCRQLPASHEGNADSWTSGECEGILCHLHQGHWHRRPNRDSVVCRGWLQGWVECTNASENIQRMCLHCPPSILDDNNPSRYDNNAVFHCDGPSLCPGQCFLVSAEEVNW